MLAALLCLTPTDADPAALPRRKSTLKWAQDRELLFITVPLKRGADTRCVVLKNMFDRLSDEAMSNPNFFTELAEDVRGECAKLGTVLFCAADKWSNGFVYVKMLTNGEAARLIEVMHGRYFARNKIIASSIEEPTIDKKFKLVKH